MYAQVVCIMVLLHVTYLAVKTPISRTWTLKGSSSRVCSKVAMERVQPVIFGCTWLNWVTLPPLWDGPLESHSLAHFMLVASFFSYLTAFLLFLQDKVRNGDSSPWWSSLLRWAQAPSTCLFLMIGTVLHACWAKPFFQEFHARGIVSVAAAHLYVLQFQAALRSWALDPKLALQLEGKGMAIVQTHPLLPILLRRLRVVLRVMSEQWEKYSIVYRNGGALDPTSSPHLSALQATPCTSVFEESFFGALSNQWKLMGPTAAPWRVTATAISRANASVDMPLLEEDVP